MTDDDGLQAQGALPQFRLRSAVLRDAAQRGDRSTVLTVVRETELAYGKAAMLRLLLEANVTLPSAA